jgi:transcriptional regulator with XRE-family HTH domain
MGGMNTTNKKPANGRTHEGANPACEESWIHVHAAFCASGCAVLSDQACVHGLRLGAAVNQASVEALEGCVAGVWDVSVDELRQPRITDVGLSSDGSPIALSDHQDGLDFNVESGFHAGTLVNNSLSVKEHITKSLVQPQAMQEKSINHVVAANLLRWMGEADVTQSALAEKAGVSQKTISNYLNPGQRDEGTSGKQPSAKLTELDRIAKALHIEVWQLTRQMSIIERKMYEAIEIAYENLRASAVPAPGIADAAEYERIKNSQLPRRRTTVKKAS